MQFRAGRHRRQREIIGRIGSHNVAAYRALVADADVGNILPAFRQCGKAFADDPGCLELVMGDEAAQAQRPLSLGDCVETGDAAEINHLGNWFAEFHAVDEIDAARHENGAITGLGTHLDGLARGTRSTQPELGDHLARAMNRQCRHL